MIGHRTEDVPSDVDRDPELVDLEAGRNVGMTFRVDVRVHANCDTSTMTGLFGNRLDTLKLSGRLDVDGFQPQRDGAFEFSLRLANARKHDVPRHKTRSSGDFDLPDRIRIDRTSKLLQELDDGKG